MPKFTIPFQVHVLDINIGLYFRNIKDGQVIAFTTKLRVMIMQKHNLTIALETLFSIKRFHLLANNPSTYISTTITTLFKIFVLSEIDISHQIGKCDNVYFICGRKTAHEINLQFNVKDNLTS